MSTELLAHLSRLGIEVKQSPTYLPASNGFIERLVQEHWTRTRVMMFGSELPQRLRAEEMYYADWLRNCLPSSHIDGAVPIRK